jgi:hypothetical protein
MAGLIGYYVHHQGAGHFQRALAIATQAPDRFVLLGTGLTEIPGGPRCLSLEDDRPTTASNLEPLSPSDCLHYVPQRHVGVQRRVAQITNWIVQERPSLFVVDVSVEVAMLSRLASIPTVYVRLSGERTDAGHLQAFRGACGLIAPFHSALDDPLLPAWIRTKTAYFAGLGRAVQRRVPDAAVVLCVNGQGGAALDGVSLAMAASCTPELSWRVMGPSTQPAYCPPNLAMLGWVDNVEDEMAGAGIVIGSAGDGVVNAVIAAGRPFVCLPQSRPYDEQGAKARQLSALGVAVVLQEFPAPTEWAEIFHRARELNLEALDGLHDPDGRSKACEFLCQLATK